MANLFGDDELPTAPVKPEKAKPKPREPPAPPPPVDPVRESVTMIDQAVGLLDQVFANLRDLPVKAQGPIRLRLRNEARGILRELEGMADGGGLDQVDEGSTGQAGGIPDVHRSGA